MIANQFYPYVGELLQTMPELQSQLFCDCVAVAGSGSPVNDQECSSYWKHDLDCAVFAGETPGSKPVCRTKEGRSLSASHKHSLTGATVTV